jgi:hypothetical protein
VASVKKRVQLSQNMPRFYKSSITHLRNFQPKLRNSGKNGLAHGGFAEIRTVHGR